MPKPFVRRAGPLILQQGLKWRFEPIGQVIHPEYSRTIPGETGSSSASKLSLYV